MYYYVCIMYVCMYINTVYSNRDLSVHQRILFKIIKTLVTIYTVEVEMRCCHLNLIKS